MLSLTKRLHTLPPCLRAADHQLRWARTDTGPPRRRPKSPAFARKKPDEKSDWWIVDGEMHEIGDNVPPRERFVIPRDNIPNKRRKQLREQFMRRTRLVLKESEHEPWCKRYMELYQELRENWERLYWDEGYSKKLALDHANYESAEDDDQDFSPYRTKRYQAEQHKTQTPVSDSLSPTSLLRWFSEARMYKEDQGFGRNKQGDSWEKVGQIRDKFEYDREKRMREKAFGPMNGGTASDLHESNSWKQPFDAQRYFSRN